MFEVMNFIKDHDVSHRPKIVNTYMTPIMGSMPSHASLSDNLGYIIRPNMENLNLNSGNAGLGTQES
jgi:hypothetical protein